MDEEPNPKIASQKCLESTTLDPDFYRIGHTKARIFLLLHMCFYLHVKCFLNSLQQKLSPLSRLMSNPNLFNLSYIFLIIFLNSNNCD